MNQEYNFFSVCTLPKEPILNVIKMQNLTAK